MNKIELANLEALTRSHWKLILNQGFYSIVQKELKSVNRKFGEGCKKIRL